MAKKSQIKADVVIAGGGLVGMAVALGLASANSGPGLNVLIVEGQAVDHTIAPGFDGRASAISAASKNMLEAIGAWSQLDQHAQPITDIVVTDSELNEAQRPTFLRFDREDNEHWPTAYMLENRFIRQALLAQIANTPAIQILAPNKVVSFQSGVYYATVILDDGRELSAPLIIAADGRNSNLRQSAGIETVGWSYAQHGIVATIEHQHPHKGVAEEHFLPAGPFAILPLKQPCHSSLVWTESEDIVKELMAMPEAQFDHELSRRFGSHLGDIKRVGSRWSYPLSLQLAKDYVAARLILVGDAAHVVHPLAGLGFNLGLRDAAAVVEVVAQAIHLGLDFGTLDVCENYQKWRRFDNLSTAIMMDVLNRLFSNSSPTLRQIRDMGLGLVESSPAAKRFFINEAAGLSGKLPRLMQSSR